MRIRSMTAMLVASVMALTGCSGSNFGGSFCESNGGEQLLRFDFEGSEVRISGMPAYSRTVGQGLMPYEYRADEGVILIGPEDASRLTVDVVDEETLRSSDGYTLLSC